MTIRRLIINLALALLASACKEGPCDGTYTIHILSTNDVHGCYFDSTYTDRSLRNSLCQISSQVDSLRRAAGGENVVLIDAGDCLQGDNAAYYFNYVDTLSPHVWARMVRDMGYDALTVGNHDIEAGHNVYDRVYAQLKSCNLPYLAGNAVRTDNGEPYFDKYTVLERHGLRILILGYTNANMKGWLDENAWSGMDFQSLLPLVQEDVDRLSTEFTPHVVVVSVHSGTGKGDGTMLESQGMDLLKSLKGVDFIICSHDHSAMTANHKNAWLINAGSHARNIGHGTIEVEIKDGKVVRKSAEAELIKVTAERTDTALSRKYHDDFLAARAFTLKEVGRLESDLRTRDAYCGPSDYVNLIHYITMKESGADLSFCAPLTYNGSIQAGTLVFNDLFTLYPYENQLYVMNLTGKEIKDYLEYSYDNWIQNPAGTGHVLRIVKAEDKRTGQKGWSFTSRYYNFDSCAGLNYTVDVTKPCGSRVSIKSLADGSAFDTDRVFKVAMTSYRAAGGGFHLEKGAGLSKTEMQARIAARLPEIREIIYDYLRKHGALRSSDFNSPEIIGNWSFVPERIATPALEKDMTLLFD